MKKLSARNMPSMPRLSRKARQKQIVRIKNSKTRMNEYSENANYNIEDVATDKEALESNCDCIIHSGGKQPAQERGYMKMWYDG